MNVVCGRVYQFWQGIYVGAKQFLQSSVFQYFAYHIVLVAQSLQNLFAGNILASLCLLCLGVEFEYIKEDFTHLTR